MKYSKQQLRNINKNYDDMRMRARLQNLKSNALQNVIVDKQIPVDLLDRRNINDIENDKFFRKAVLNEYSNKILPVQEIHEFHQSLKDNNLETFFIQNFPKIQLETKMFKYIDGDDLFKITKRLYNKDIKELDEDRELKYKKQNMEDTKALLQEIVDNLKTMPKTRDVKKIMDKVDAIFQTAQHVQDNGGDPDTFFGNLFGDGDVQQTLNTVTAPAIDNAMQQALPDPNVPDPNAPDPNAPDPNAPDPNAPVNNAPIQNIYEDLIKLAETLIDNEQGYANFLGSLSDIEASTFIRKTSQNKMTKHFLKKATIDQNVNQKTINYYIDNWGEMGKYFRTIGSMLRSYGFVYRKNTKRSDVYDFLTNL